MDGVLARRLTAQASTPFVTPPVVGATGAVAELAPVPLYAATRGSAPVGATIKARARAKTEPRLP